MIVVSDTSPLCYLVLIEKISILPQLFGEVIIPQAVYDELRTKDAPIAVQNWANYPPSWLKINSTSFEQTDEILNSLDSGERQAIQLAEYLGAELVMIDEKLARNVARERGLNVTGLLGILEKAAQVNLLNFSTAIEQLQQTNFRVSPLLVKSLLEKWQTLQ